MLVNEIANHIKTLPFVDADIPVRVATLEASETKGIIVMTPLAGLSSNPELPNYFRGNVRIVVRDNSPEAGDALAELLMTAMEVKGAALILPNYKINQFISIHLPIMYPRNDAGLYEHSLTFDCVAQRL